MNPLEQIIIKKIRNEGPISFRDFMDMALYYPGLGYYASPETTIGRKGDFYTSPHLHPVFGAVIARQLVEMWELTGKPSEFFAVEMGAGTGYLCRDIFDYLKRSSPNSRDFFNSLTYIIIEPFKHFEERQKSLLSHTDTDRITWMKSPEGLHRITGCVLSNELLDAFPVNLIEMNDVLEEIYVNYDGSMFTEEKSDDVPAEINDYLVQCGITLPQGYRTEINLQIKDWIVQVSSALSHGFILTIDYGYSNREYFSDERSKGTLLCYHKHQFNENPYQHIGKQDITAHVNFSALKKWGKEAGLKTTGYCPQGTYLTASGIDEVIIELYADSPDYLTEISKIKGLIMPQGMGASHNVMIQYKGEGTLELRGFSMRNLAGTL